MASVPIESSFAQILNRTQQNLNRINQRYAPSSVSSQSASLLGGPAASSAGVSLIGAGSSADGPGLLRERLAGKDLTNRPGPKAALNTVTINEDILRDILERLTTLESKRSEDHGVLQRVERLEKLLSNHDSALDHLTYESKDVQRQTTHLQSRISSMEMLYEANKTEAETRRAANAKIDHWIKDQDHWRDDVDRLTTQLRRELSDFKLEKQDVQQRWQQAATKHDVDQVKDKVHLLTQQSISVAISAWTENADNKLKNLEKELALLKIGQSSAVQREIRAKTGDLLRDADDDSDADVARGASQVTAEMIAKALDTPTPSETLVKGMVASEMLQLQTSLEAKVRRRPPHETPLRTPPLTAVSPRATDGPPAAADAVDRAGRDEASAGQPVRAADPRDRPDGGRGPRRLRLAARPALHGGRRRWLQQQRRRRRRRGHRPPAPRVRPPRHGRQKVRRPPRRCRRLVV